MKKRYIGDLIADGYKRWECKKIFLTAPTGSGKTTFVVKNLVPYFFQRRKRTMVLCNRRILRNQYVNDFIWEYSFPSEMNEAVCVMSYQQLAEMLRSGDSLIQLLAPYELIICDECHYFYADSDFNMFGTYILLQALVDATFSKTVLWMTATMAEVKPLIEGTINGYATKNRRNLPFETVNGIMLDETENIERILGFKECIEYDFSWLASFEKFRCEYYSSKEALCENLANSCKKSLIFIDDRKSAEELKQELIKKGVECNEIKLLNSQILDEEFNREWIQKLMYTHILPCKILITTSVLDNGFSLHDEALGNILIQTESKVSFMQMLGRVRTESITECKLLFLSMPASFYRRRMEQYMEKKNLFERMGGFSSEKILLDGWYANGVNGDSYKNYVGIFKSGSDYYKYHMDPPPKIHISRGEFEIVWNCFAKKKIENMLFEENRFFQRAIYDPVEAIYYQMSWINKGSEELVLADEKFYARKREEFLESLLEVQNYTKDELKEKMGRVVQLYHADFFPGILTKGTLSNDKITKICAEHNLIFSVDENSNPRRYTIKKNSKRR